MMCVYCKSYGARSVGGIPLCDSCGGRFVEKPTAPAPKDKDA